MNHSLKEPNQIGAYELVRDRRDAERDRLRGIDSKIAPIIAVAIAALALFVDKDSGVPDLVAASSMLVPIAMLFRVGSCNTSYAASSKAGLSSPYNSTTFVIKSGRVRGGGSSLARHLLDASNIALMPVVGEGDSRLKTMLRPFATAFRSGVTLLQTSSAEKTTTHRPDISEIVDTFRLKLAWTDDVSCASVLETCRSIPSRSSAKARSNSSTMP